MRKFVLIISCVVMFYSAKCDIRLPSLVSSDMVLQQQSDVKLWGWASPGEKIFIITSWNNKVDSVVTTRDAAWQLIVKTPGGGGPYNITLKGNNTIVLQNVMIGEVWICSGQSNMEMSETWGLPDVKAELPKCYNNNIRFFYVSKATSKYPQDNCNGQWTVCDSNTLKTFSAAGYFFGKKLNEQLHVPVGLINANWGGTPAEVWTPVDSINNDPVLKEAASKQQPYDWWPYTPGATFNAMIAPVINYNIAGAIWYQGEANTPSPTTYAKLLTAMINSWRSAWNKQLPFYYVQIAPYKYGDKNVAALIREQQAKVMSLSNVGMVVVTDLVDNINDIHPKDKHDVGYRLANWALAETYHQSGTVYKNPVYKNMEVQQEKAIIHFDNASNGLMSKEKNITEIYIAGDDKVFYPAEARIQNDQLIVWSKQVKQPVAVRFGFSNTAIPDLFSKEGLPVCPFRTDNWEVDTSKEQ